MFHNLNTNNLSLVIFLLKRGSVWIKKSQLLLRINGVVSWNTNCTFFNFSNSRSKEPFFWYLLKKKNIKHKPTPQTPGRNPSSDLSQRKARTLTLHGWKTTDSLLFPTWTQKSSPVLSIRNSDHESRGSFQLPKPDS